MLELPKFTIDLNEKRIVEQFINGINNKKYIMGISRDGHAKELSSLVDIDGFINDFTNIEIFLGKPIVKTNNINKNSLIVVCSTVRTRTIVNLLKEKGFKNVIAYPTFFRYTSETKLPLKIIKDFDVEISKNIKKYDFIYKKLKDLISKDTFLSLLQYRATCSLEYVKDFKFDQVGQYFEDFLNLQSGEVFIDVGGFDGQTSVEFIKHCPNYKSIYIFEPSENNLTKAKENLKNYRNVNFISKGLSNQKDILKFDAEPGSASIISEKGTTIIEVDTLDNLVQEKVSFIKIDIEGWERMAIEGMRNHILNDHPKMAISVYHKVDDFWKIPEQVFAIRHDYDIYMRHYTEGTDETVMFFMPKQS